MKNAPIVEWVQKEANEFLPDEFNLIACHRLDLPGAPIQTYLRWNGLENVAHINEAFFENDVQGKKRLLFFLIIYQIIQIDRKRVDNIRKNRTAWNKIKRWFKR